MGRYARQKEEYDGQIREGFGQKIRDLNIPKTNMLKEVLESISGQLCNIEGASSSSET